MIFSQILQRITERLWSEHNMILLEYTPNGNEYQNVSNRYELVNENNLLDVLCFDSMNYIKIYKQMMKKGEVGILGYLNGRCVFRHWIQMNGDIIHEGTKILTLENKMCYSHYVFCDEAARKRGFHTESIKYIKNIYPDYKIYTLVNIENKKSLNNYLRTGFSIKEEINVKMRFFSRKVVIIKSYQ